MTVPSTNLRHMPPPLLDAAFVQSFVERVRAEIAEHPQADFESFMAGYVRGVIAGMRCAERGAA